MANPRKFSEKIALHNQKQAEETAAFEQIMREVIGATRVSPRPGPPLVSALDHQDQYSTAGRPEQRVQGTAQLKNQHLHINTSVGNCRAGSLPNVNHVGTGHDKSSIDLQSALNNLEDIRQGRDPTRERRHASPVGTTSQHTRGHSHHGHGTRQYHFTEKRADASPYSTPYLSPPDVWRRTNSDSALHQSAMMSDHEDDFYVSAGSASSPRRSTVHAVDSTMLVVASDHSLGSNGTTMAWDPGKRYYNFHPSDLQTDLLSASLPTDSRPKSCEVPGITIYPTTEDPNSSHHHHIPISSNTGSLPDLTNLHFPAPLATPIDIEDQSMGGVTSASASNSSTGVMLQYNASPSPGGPGSPYSGHGPPSPSPYSTSASNCGPSSPYSPQSPGSAAFSPPPAMTQRMGGNILLEAGPGGGGGGGGGGALVNGSNGVVADDRHPSPGPSPSPTASRRQAHHNISNLVIGSGSPRHPGGEPLSPQHHQQGLAIDTSALSLDGNSRYSANNVNQTQQNFGYTGSSHQQYQSMPQGQNYVPPTSALQQQQQQHQQQQQQQQQQLTMGLHRSATPSDHSCSAPTSPVSHTISPINSPGLPQNAAPLSKSPFTDNSYYNVQQTSVLQHQLEQFKMVTSDLQSDSSEHYLMMPESAAHSTSSSASSSTGGLYMSSNTLPQSPRGSLGDASGDYSPQPSPQSTLMNNTSSSVDVQSTVYYSSSTQATRSTLIQSTSPLVYSKSVISSPSSYQQPLQHHQQTIDTTSAQSPTSQTSNSIPDIILTGPNADDSLLRNQDFAKEIGSAMAGMAGMSGSFDENDLFSSAEEAFRAGLDPIDFDGLQILTDITDAANEDNFRS